MGMTWSTMMLGSSRRRSTLPLRKTTASGCSALEQVAKVSAKQTASILLDSRVFEGEHRHLAARGSAVFDHGVADAAEHAADDDLLLGGQPLDVRDVGWLKRSRIVGEFVQRVAGDVEAHDFLLKVEHSFFGPRQRRRPALGGLGLFLFFAVGVNGHRTGSCRWTRSSASWAPLLIASSIEATIAARLSMPVEASNAPHLISASTEELY